jgi:FkbM family methyltransferase
MYVLGGYEEKRIGLFKAEVPRGGVLLDIGANIGNHALALSDHFDEIHAFEPNPDVFERLVGNVARNPGVPIQAVNAGLGAEAGALTFYRPVADATNRGTGTFVRAQAPEQFSETQLPVMTGDDYVEAKLGGRKVAAIKIDVQGFEPDVLRGLTRTIERDRPAIWIEVTPATQAGLAAALPRYPTRLRAFVNERKFGLINTEVVRNTTLNEMLSREGDYLIQPA